MNIFIAGSSMTKFGELWDKSLADLLTEAIQSVLVDADLKPNQIDAIYVANKASGLFTNQLHLGAMASQLFSHFPPAVRIEGACASGGLALIAAQTALLSGIYQTVLVVGVEKMTDVDSGETTKILSAAADFETEFGSTFPGLYAMLAQQHMLKYGTTRDQLSQVAVKNHHHGVNNPLAQFQKEITIQQVNQSTLVADPLRLLDCSPITDGAAAVILTTKKNKGVRILGFGQGQDSLDLAGRINLTSLPATQKAMKLALAQADTTAKQIEVAEVHDCFTIAELLALEDLGFFIPGKAAQATQDQQTTYGGKIVINPSGGLKACGHPVGATGVKQVAYLSKLIQSGQFKLGLTHNVGGSGATAVVHILGK